MVQDGKGHPAGLACWSRLPALQLGPVIDIGALTYLTPALRTMQLQAFPSTENFGQSDYKRIRELRRLFIPGTYSKERLARIDELLTEAERDTIVETSPNELRIEVSGPTVTKISYLVLPGIYHNHLHAEKPHTPDNS